MWLFGLATLRELAGRTLLIDQDGLYNSWLCRHAGANVVLALKGVETPDGTVANDDAVDELVAAGQTSIEALYHMGRFLTWRDEPSRTQLDRIEELRSGEAFPPFEPTPAMIECDQSRSTRRAHHEGRPSIRAHLARNAAFAKSIALPIVSKAVTALHRFHGGDRPLSEDYTIEDFEELRDLPRFVDDKMPKRTSARQDVAPGR